MIEEKKVDMEAALAELEYEIGLAIRQSKMSDQFIRTVKITESGAQWVISLVVARLVDAGSCSGSARS